MKIKRYIEEAHEYFVSVGEYTCPECGGKGEYFTFCHLGMCDVCDGTGIDPNKNIGEMLMQIVGELCKVEEAYQEGLFLKEINDICNDGLFPGEKYFIYDFEEYFKDNYEDHIAMVFIRIFALCGYLGIILKYKNFPIVRPWGNIGSDLYYILCKLPPDTGYENDLEITSLNLIFSILFDFCEYHKIQIQKHIEARLAYMKETGHE
jgi:hypothetical protein